MSWSASRSVAAWFLVAGGIAFAFAAVQDAAGRILVGLVAAALVAEGLRCLLVRPTLAVHDEGITVVHGVRRTRVPWDQVRDVRALGSDGDRPRRRAKALELDLGHTVVLVSAYRLGRPLAEVVSEVAAARPPSHS